MIVFPKLREIYIFCKWNFVIYEKFFLQCTQTQDLTQKCGKKIDLCFSVGRTQKKTYSLIWDWNINESRTSYIIGECRGKGVDFVSYLFLNMWTTALDAWLRTDLNYLLFGEFRMFYVYLTFIVFLTVPCDKYMNLSFYYYLFKILLICDMYGDKNIFSTNVL